jgi:hypothetical protein
MTSMLGPFGAYHSLGSDAIGDANLVRRYHHVAHKRRTRRPIKFHLTDALKYGALKGEHIAVAQPYAAELRQLEL